jgi:hypothetical protein
LSGRPVSQSFFGSESDFPAGLPTFVLAESLRATALRFRYRLIAVLTPLYESIHHAVVSSLEEIAAAFHFTPLGVIPFAPRGKWF